MRMVSTGRRVDRVKKVAMEVVQKEIIGLVEAGAAENWELLRFANF